MGVEELARAMAGLGWWGRYYSYAGEEPRWLWVGPLTEKEMRADFYEFRYNWRPDAPSNEEED